jgi:hypothetical protein
LCDWSRTAAFVAWELENNWSFQRWRNLDMVSEWTWDGRFYSMEEDPWRIQAERVSDRFCRVETYWTFDLFLFGELVDRDHGYFDQASAELECKRRLERILEDEEIFLKEHSYAC